MENELKQMLAHGWLWWVIVGLAAGILAKMIMPGSRDKPSGCLMTIVLGIAGAVLTGLVMSGLLPESWTPMS